jgi:transcriptional regulator with XRE-family HTH domain
LKIEPEDLRVLVGFLRLLGSRTQAAMAKAARLNPSTLCRYEKGTRIPDRPAIERLARTAGVAMWKVDGAILPAIAVARAAAPGELDQLPRSLQQALAAAIEQEPSHLASAALAEFLAEQEPGNPAGGRESSAPGTAGQEGVASPDPWALAPATVGDLLSAPSAWWPDFEALAERLCEASVRAAADDAACSLALARLALRLAELAPGPAPWRCRLEGFTWAFVGNAQRVGSDLLAAAASLATAWRLWRAGASAPDSRLAEWRLLDLEASLRRDQRRFAVALELLDRALAAAPPAARGRLLLNKSFTLEQAGEIAPALAALEAAAAQQAVGGEPRASWILSINRLVLLCHLGRYAEAAAGLPELDAITRELANDIDQLRACWLAARVWAGLGWAEEARVAFEEVRREFTSRLLGYDTALVSLELAILHLEAGRRAEVRELAKEMLWIFTAQGVEREALAALSLFREAVESDRVNIELARRVLRTVEGARGAPRPLRAGPS